MISAEQAYQQTISTTNEANAKVLAQIEAKIAKAILTPSFQIVYDGNLSEGVLAELQKQKYKIQKNDIRGQYNESGYTRYTISWDKPAIAYNTSQFEDH